MNGNKRKTWAKGEARALSFGFSWIPGPNPEWRLMGCRGVDGREWNWSESCNWNWNRIGIGSGARVGAGIESTGRMMFSCMSGV